MIYLIVLAVLICVIGLVLTQYNIRYKGECILHDWEYKFEYGDYWRVTGTFLEAERVTGISRKTIKSIVGTKKEFKKHSFKYESE